MIRLSFLIICFFVFVSVVFAQKADYRFEHLTIEDGLSQSTINAILQDRQGYMWFGTFDGLNRYDGYQFYVYRHSASDPQSLSNNNIMALFEDSQGYIWVSTRGGGLNRFDPKTETFTHYRHDPKNPNSISSDHVTQLWEDKNGRIWAATWKGLNCIDIKTSKITRFNREKGNSNTIISDYVVTLQVDPNFPNRLWLGTDEGITCFDIELGKAIRHLVQDAENPESLSDNVIWACVLEGKDAMWFGTWKNGITRLNLQTLTFEHFKPTPNSENTLQDGFVRALFFDRNGSLWIGTNLKGLSKLDLKTKQFSHFHNQEDNPQSLPSNTVQSIYEDYTGDIWLGLIGGIGRFNALGTDFKTYRQENYNLNSLIHNYVWAVFEDSKKFLWVGTREGLTCMNRKTDQYFHFLHEEKNPNSISHDAIRCVFEDSKNRIWVGNEKGLNLLDRKTGNFKRYMLDEKNPTNSSFGRVMAIVEDSEGFLWLATRYGLVKFDVEKEAFTFFREDTNTISNQSLISLLRVGHDLWIGTENGLDKLNLKTMQFDHFKHNPTDSTSLVSNAIRSFCLTKDSTVWIGTSNGFSRFDSKTRKFESFRVQEGLPNDLIYGILEDEKGFLWLSTNRGLSRFDPRGRKFKNYTIKDGLQSSEFNTGAYFKNQEGEMFFGGINGLNSFFPAKIRNNNQVPPLVFTDFKIQNKSVGIRKNEEFSLSQNINFVKEITLLYKQNTFEFEFSALNFKHSNRNRYSYKLDGFDENWISSGTRRFANYTNVPAGTYTLRVIGSNNDGIWNEDGIHLKITIQPPFWETTWFRATFSAFVIALGFGIYRQRVRNIKEQKRKLEELVTMRTLEVMSQKEEIEQQKEQIEVQKRLIEDKNKNIIASINYAKRIQDTMLPEREYFSELLPDSFIFFKPRDVVSGDVYWIFERNNKVFVSVVDCTGHGVPGAFMSMIAFEQLVEIVNVYGIEQPDEILNYLHEGVRQILKQRKTHNRDGMDISIVVLEKNAENQYEKLTFAGAKNPMFLVQYPSVIDYSNPDWIRELAEFKADRMGIGGEQKEMKRIFSRQEVSLKPEEKTVFYLFSDGYIDQFGGLEHKKFSKKRLKALCQEMYDLDMTEQEKIIRQTLDNWVGMGKESQIDDILIMGVRV